MLRRNQEHPTELASLLGKRLIVASETEEGGTLRLQLVKRLTGDEQITARFMRQDFFTFRRTHKLLMVTNNKPRVPESSEAAWRRIRLIPFDVTIPLERRDPQLLAKLKAEASGILAWIVAERRAHCQRAADAAACHCGDHRVSERKRSAWGLCGRSTRARRWITRRAGRHCGTITSHGRFRQGKRGTQPRPVLCPRPAVLANVPRRRVEACGEKVRGFIGLGLKATNGVEHEPVAGKTGGFHVSGRVAALAHYRPKQLRAGG